MSRWLDNQQPWGALLMRLVLGVSMALHGWQKIAPGNHFAIHHPLSGMDHFCHVVVSLGMPYWLGYVSTLTEFFGGIFLLLGFLTRFSAFMVTGNLLVALVRVNLHHGYDGCEYTLALIALSVMLLVYGGGAAALDRRLGIS